MTKILFLDLDETLIAARFVGSGERGEAEYKENPFTHISIAMSEDCTEVYRAVLRPGAVNFITAMRKRYGDENVFILTAATTEYARKWNALFGLGFTDERIIAREDYCLKLHCFDNDLSKVGVLVDNLPSRELESKHAFLDRNGIRHAVVTVNDFYGAADDNLFTEDYVSPRVEEAFKSLS